MTTSPLPRFFFLFVFMALVLAVSLFGPGAGELDPPGPPGSTMKPLPDLEPRQAIRASMLPLTITQSGSYYLAENVGTGTAGITVAASDVTIDLNGFALKGGCGSGIYNADTDLYKNITVKNGTVAGWNEGGLNLGNGARVENVRAENNLVGIYVLSDSFVIGCSAGQSQGFAGILARAGSIIRDTIAWDNAQNGIFATDGVLIEGCTARNNGGSGIYVGQECLVRNNTLQGNALISEVLGGGIFVEGEKNRIEANHAAHNRYGFVVLGNGNTVIRNTAAQSWIESIYVDPAATGNLIGPFRDSLSAAGPWDNLDN